MGCGVGFEVMSSKSVTTYPYNGGIVFSIFLSEFVITYFVCDGEVSFSFGLLIMQLANIKESNSLL